MRIKSERKKMHRRCLPIFTAVTATVIGYRPRAVHAANSLLTFDTGTSLLTASDYNTSGGVSSSLPTATTDVLFNTYPASGTLLSTISGANSLSVGSIDDENPYTINISNGTASTTASLVLGGPSSANNIAPAPTDLLYVPLGSTLNIVGNNSTGILGIQLNQAGGTFDINGNASIGSIISDGGNGYGIIKTGTGNLTLSAVNTFSGGLNVAAGAVSVSSSTYLGANTSSLGVTTTLNGGQIVFTNPSNLLPGYSKLWSLGTNGGTFNIPSTSAYTVLEGVISGAGSLTKVGPGILILQAQNSSGALIPNTYTGGTFVNQGTLELYSTSALGPGQTTLAPGTAFNYIGTGGGPVLPYTDAFSLNGAGNDSFGVNYSSAQTLYLDGVISGSGTLVKTGPGSLELAPSNGSNYITNTFTGGINVSTGSLLYATNGGLPSGQITLAGGTTIGYVNTSTTSSLSALVTFSLGGTVTFTYNNSGQTYNIQGAVSGAGSIIKTGSTILEFSGQNTYGGTTLASSGALEFVNEISLYNDNTSSWNTSNIIVSPGATLAFGVGGGGQFTASDLSILTALGTANAGFENGSYIGLDTTGGNYTYSQPITNTNGNANVIGLNKLGTNTLTLTGTNTYTGITYVTNGVLDFQVVPALPNPNTNSVTVLSGAVAALGVGGPGQFTSAQVDMFRANQTFNSGASIGFDTSQASSSFTYASAITNSSAGALGVYVTGSNPLILTGANTYGGTTNISSGSTLIIANGGSSGLLGTGNVVDNGILEFNYGSGVTVTVANLISGTGTVVQDGSGTVIMSSTNNSQAGNSIINAGVLEVSATTNGSGSATTPITINSGAYRIDVTLSGSVRGATLGSTTSTIDIAAGQLVNLTGLISGSNSTASLNVNGTSATDTGTLELTNANTYTGMTNVNAGYLVANNNSNGTSGPFGYNSAVTLANVASSGIILNPNLNVSIGSLAGGGTLGGTVNVAGGTLTTGGNNTVTSFAGAIFGTGGLTIVGTGSQTLSGIDTYTGPTAVTSGTLILASTSSFPTGGALNISGGTASVAPANTGNAIGISVGQLNIRTGGTLNLNTNALVVHGSNLATVWPLVRTGYAGGAWNGSGGITSANATAGYVTAATSGNGALTAIGVILNDTTGNYGNVSGTALTTTFAGAATVAGDVLVKYTYYGDTNLSGSVDGSDYANIDNGYSLGLTGWYNGDFNYDGAVNGSDYTLMDNAFNSQGAQLAGIIASPDAVATDQIAGATSAVPEPASLGLFGVAALGLLGRRSRRK